MDNDRIQHLLAELQGSLQSENVGRLIHRIEPVGIERWQSHLNILSTLPPIQHLIRCQPGNPAIRREGKVPNDQLLTRPKRTDGVEVFLVPGEIELLDGIARLRVYG